MKRLAIRQVHGWILGASALALLAAYVAEFGFDLRPCHLCDIQRYPYMAAALCSLCGLYVRHRARIMLQAGGVSLAVGACVAWYHSGVERGLFEGPGGCTTGGAVGDNIEALRAAILSSPLIACDRPAFEWFGVSMANVNAVYATVLAALVFWALRREAVV